MTNMLRDVQNSVLSLLTIRSLLFIIDLPFYYAFIYLYKWKDFSKKFTYKFLVGSLLATILVFLVTSVSNNMNVLRYQELFTFHTMDIKDQVFSSDSTYIVKEKFSQKDIDDLKDRGKLIDGPLTGISSGKNLIVLQVEALQNFVINLTYNNQEITPNLNNLIKDSGSIYYDNYFQLLGRGNTSDAEFVVNNSLHPSMESPTYTQYEQNTYYGLPWLLRDNGYKSWVFHGYDKTFWNRDKAYVNQGFQRFLSQDDYEIGDIIELGLTDEDFFSQSIEYLEELDTLDENPFYAFLVTLSSHNPFSIPEKYKEVDLLDKHKDTILGDYLNSIHYADKAIGQFINDLKAEGLYDESLLVLYGDHFAIQNSSQDILDLMDDFLGQKYNFDHIMNVPLIINIPNSNVNKTNHKVGSHLDLYPTILNLMGLENQKGIMFGRDLENYNGYNNVKAQTILRKGSFIDDEVIFQMAATEIFDHALVTSRISGQEYDPNDYREVFEEAISEINLSDYIMKENLMENIINNEDIESSKSPIDDIQNYKIEKSTNNSVSDVNKIYKTRGPFISLKLGLNSEDIVVLEDENQTIAESLLNWSEDKDDVRFFFRFDDTDREFYNKLRYALPRSKNKDVIEISSFENYYFSQSYGFENIILNLSENSYTSEELTDFIKAHSLFGVIVENNSTSNELLKTFYENGVLVYVENTKDISIKR